MNYTAFTALTLLFGWEEGHPACKKTEWWMHGYLSGSGSRCRFAYGPADATATPSSLASVKSRMVHLSGASLPRLSWKKAVKRVCVCVCACVHVCVKTTQTSCIASLTEQNNKLTHSLNYRHLHFGLFWGVGLLLGYFS